MVDRPRDNPPTPAFDVIVSRAMLTAHGSLLALTIELDLDGRITYADHHACALMGCTEPLGLDWFGHCVDPAEHDRLRARFRALIAADSDSPAVFDGRCIDVQGVNRRVQWHMVLLRGDDGRATGIRVAGALLTEAGERPAVASALEQLLELRYAIDQASIVAVTDRKGVITYVNDTFCRISGYARDELLGQTHRIINSGHHPSGFFKEMWATIGRGRVWRGDVCNRAKDGELYWVSTTIVPFIDHGSKPYQYMAIRSEITELKRTEAALAQTVSDLEAANRRIVEEHARMLQAEKLSSVGLLAAGVAHEINNPLAGTMACIKQLRDGKVAEHRRDTYFETVLDGLERIQGIVKALLNYARPVTPSHTEVVLGDIIDGCALLIRPALHKQRVTLDHRGAEGVWAIGDRQQLMQAVMNVLLNAVHASPPGSTVVIDHPLDAERVGIRIKDSGPGIPPAYIDRVCDPFFSTKPEGTGTGLGLSVTLGIVQANGGDLQIESAEGEGATVTLWLRRPDATGERAREDLAGAP